MAHRVLFELMFGGVFLRTNGTFEGHQSSVRITVFLCEKKNKTLFCASEKQETPRRTNRQRSFRFKQFSAHVTDKRTITLLNRIFAMDPFLMVHQRTFQRKRFITILIVTR